MGKVIGFVVHFFPTGLFECASGPLADAALDLMTNLYNPSKSRARARSYHSEYKGDSFEWDGCKVIIKDNADVVLVLKPRFIDNFLDYGVSIWITWAPVKIELL